MNYSPWSPFECIALDTPDDTDKDWCSYLLNQKGELCNTYAPRTREKTDQDLRDFLVWKNDKKISTFFEHKKYNHYFHIQPDFHMRGRDRVKCGSVCGLLPGTAPPPPPTEMMMFAGAGGRRKRKQTRRRKHSSRKTRRSHK